MLNYIVDKFELVKFTKAAALPKHTERIFVPKGWGYEDWIVNNDKYCGKELFFKKGKRCSYHYHELKDETFYIASGQLLITYSYDQSSVKEIGGKKTLCIWGGGELENLCQSPDWHFNYPKYGAANYLVLEPGDHFHVPPGLIHAMYGLQDTKMFEFSTQHFDSDSIRILKGN